MTLDAVGDCLTNCMIYLELHNSYWPELDLDDADDEENCFHCGEEFITCNCPALDSEIY